MPVEIEHVPKRTETVEEVVGDPEEGDEVLEHVEKRGKDYYRVEREITITEEQFVVYTEDGMGKESRTYYVEQNEDGEWYVAKVRKNPNRGHPTVKGSNVHDELSTPTVREVLREKHDIEVVN